MKQVRLAPFQFNGKVYSALLNYGNDDLVQSWDLLYGNLNLSKMTYKQVKESTGLTEADIARIAAAIQLHIDKQEGRV